MNNNLLRLIYSHKKCGLSNEQILSVLLGMGIIPEVAQEHLTYYNKIATDGVDPMQLPDLAPYTGFQVPAKENINKTNENNNMRNFNLIQLYENLVQTAEDLHELATVKANASYSAVSAYSIVESALTKFPGEVNLMIGRKNAGLPVDENKLDPSLKYSIAESLYNMLDGSFLVPVKTLCAYIKSTMQEDKWGYVGAKLMNECSRKSSNNMYAALYEQVQNALLSSDIYESLKKIASDSEFWCNEAKQVIALMESEQFVEKKELNNTIVQNNNYSLVSMFSPVIVEGNTVTFNLYGKNYTMKDGKLLESRVKDEKYNDVVNGLSLMHFNPKDNSLEYFGVNGKVLEYKLDENKICIGNNDLTKLASIDLRDSLSISGLFNKSNSKDINTLVKMFESKDLITNLDNCINLHSDLNPAVFLTLIAVEEGFYVNSVDYSSYVNEMKFFKSATATKNYIQNCINYDATNILMEALKAEGDRYAEVVEERKSIQERIDFLKEKRGEVLAKIESMPENIDLSALTAALNLLESEIKENETELCDTYKKDECGGNCVPVKVANIVGTLVPGDIVYVDAATFAAAPDYTTLTVTDPKTGSAIVVNKTDLIFDLNHNCDGCCDTVKKNSKPVVAKGKDSVKDDSLLVLDKCNESGSSFNSNMSDFVTDSAITNNMDLIIDLISNKGEIEATDLDGKPILAPVTPETIFELFPNMTKATYQLVEKQLRNRQLSWMYPDNKTAAATGKFNDYLSEPTDLDDSTIKRNLNTIISLITTVGEMETVDDNNKIILAPVTPESIFELFPNMTKTTYQLVEYELKRKNLRWLYPNNKAAEATGKFKEFFA